MTHETDLKARTAAWNQYWASGPLHSCPGTYVGNYSGSVADFWQPLFANLGNEDRLLDLASGNGSLMALAVQAHDRNAAKVPEVIGVDVAAPHPGWIFQQEEALQSRISLQGGVRIEELPFPDAHFDCIVSQYGFEYADRSPAVSEVLRVAKPAATIALVCHHADSRLVEVASEEVANLGWLLDETGFVEQTRNMLPFIARSVTQAGIESLKHDAAANRAREAFNATVTEIKQRAETAKVPDALHIVVDNLPGLMRHTTVGGDAVGRQALEDWVAMMRSAMLRSKELIDFALDRQAVDEIKRRLESEGFSVTISELMEENYLMGWTILALRSSA